MYVCVCVRERERLLSIFRPQRDREVEQLHQNLEDYRRQLESSTDRRLELSNYRDMIGQREDEIRKQIDKIEVHVCLYLIYM